MTQRQMAVIGATVGFAFGFVASLTAGVERFDKQVRAKFFAGFGGDKQALAAAMKECEQVLASNPNHAEAKVWYGAGEFYIAGEYFRAGDREKGQAAFASGIQHMDEAVQLEPDNIGVRIPRGAVLLTGSRYLPPETARPLLDRGLQGYEHSLQLHSARLDTLAPHPRGELFFGLAEGWSRAGDRDKAASYFRRIVDEIPGTVYATRAQQWLQTGSLPLKDTGCVGCHTGPSR